MRMSATGCCRPKIARMGSTVSQPMYMVAYCFNIIVSIGIKMFPGLPLVSRALDYMIEVWNYTNRYKGMSIIVKIYAPRITAPFGKYFKLMSCWVIAPDPGIDLGSIFVRCSWFANIGMGKDPLYSIEPSIWPPTQII